MKTLSQEAFQYSEINLYENIEKINNIPVGFIKKQKPDIKITERVIDFFHYMIKDNLSFFSYKNNDIWQLMTDGLHSSFIKYLLEKT